MKYIKKFNDNTTKNQYHFTSDKFINNKEIRRQTKISANKTNKNKTNEILYIKN